MIWVRRAVWCGIALMTLLDQSSWRSREWAYSSTAHLK
jgi:hypothetical protein